MERSREILEERQELKIYVYASTYSYIVIYPPPKAETTISCIQGRPISKTIQSVIDNLKQKFLSAIVSVVVGRYLLLLKLLKNYKYRILF